MMSEAADSIVFIGVGNEFRGDDAAGLVMARELRRREISNLTIRETRGDAAEMIDFWTGAPMVFVGDAVQSGAQPGTIHIIDPLHDELPGEIPGSSTHGLSLERALALSRVLGSAPGRIKLFGIEGGNFQTGTEISDTVAAACSRACDLLMEELIKGEFSGVASGAQEQNDA